jgi:hypothetical protein
MSSEITEQKADYFNSFILNTNRVNEVSPEEESARDF